MSLLIWLPLNNSVENQGEAVSTLISATTRLQFNSLGGSTLNSQGKVTPYCYSNSSYTAGGYVSNSTLTLGQNQSIAAWVKFTNLTSDSSLGGAIAGQHRYPSNVGMGMTIKYVTSTTGYLSVNTGNGSSRTYNTYCGSTLLQANTWYHLCYTYDGSTIRLYVNGSLDGTHSYSGMSTPTDYFMVGCWSFGSGSGSSVYSGYKLNGSINDLRAYNHTLSAREVKELSKGLCLHYKFNYEDLYTTLPYIESSGGQYINTGIYPTANTKIDTELLITNLSTSNTWVPIYGERGSSAATYFALFVNTGSTHYISPNYAGFDPGTGANTTISYNTKYRFTTSGGSLYINGTYNSAVSTSNTLTTSTVPFYLFCIGTTSGVDNRYASMRLYSCKIWEGSSLVRDFVPSMRRSDCIVGLYDRVNRTFYTSTSSSEFTCGIIYGGSSGYNRRACLTLSAGQSNYYKITSAASKRFEIDMRWTSNSSRQLIGIGGSADEYWGNNNGSWEKIGNSQGVGINDRCVVCYDVGIINTNKTTAWIKGSSTQYVGSSSNYNTYSQSQLEIGKLTNTTGYYCNMELYGIKVFDVSNRLILNLIPVNTGLYDTLGSGMYYNQSGNVGWEGLLKEPVPDSSGFGNDGTITSVIPNTDTSFGTLSSYYEGNKYIEFATPWGNNTINQVSFSFWCKLATSTAYQFIFGAKNSPTSGAGWISLNTESRKQWFYTGQYISGASGTIPNNEWHMHTLTFNKGIGRWYLDGVFQAQTDISASRTALSAVSRLTIGDSYTGSSWSGTPFNGYISDFRIYASVLSDSDVADLYKVKESIDNKGNIFDNTTNEGTGKTGEVANPSFNKTAVIDSASLAEVMSLSDGSTWVPISVHYVPEGVFAATGTFSTSKYENTNRWTNFGFINTATRPESGYYEFMCIHQTSATGAFKTYRWKQTTNPFNATWADVNPSVSGTSGTKVIWITPTSNATGGMYWYNASNCKMCFANSSNGNWFGCGIGALWGSTYIPSYNNEQCWGYQIVYMRVVPGTHQASLIKGGLIRPTEINEKL